MVWDWAVGGVTDEVPRTIGPECENYLTNRRRVIESILFCILFVCVIKWAYKRLEPIHIADAKDTMDQRYSPMRIALMLIMTMTFGIEMGFKLANRSVIFVLNPCHIQTIVQIYLLAAKPSKVTTTMFRIQMNNLNGPLLAFIFPEVECRTLPFEQAAYWIQHAMLYIIPVYILRSGAYQAEDLHDFNWSIIGVELQLIYHFSVLNYFSMYTGVNLNHMLCAAESDPFQGEHYRIAAVIHESILCPILNKLTVYMFATPQSIQYSTKRKNTGSGETPTSIIKQKQQQYEKLTLSQSLADSSSSFTSSSTSMTRQQQQHIPPNISNQLYMHTKAPSSSCSSSSNISNTCSSTSQLKHRNVKMTGGSSGEYHQKPVSHEQQHQQQHQQQQQQHQHSQQPKHQEHHRHHRIHHPLEDEAVYEADYSLRDPEDDMEVVETTQLPQHTTITAEYRMPTTKID